MHKFIIFLAILVLVFFSGCTQEMIEDNETSNPENPECSTADDCKVNICGQLRCVNKDFQLPEGYECMLPSEDKIADYCTCEENKCVGHKAMGGPVKYGECGDNICDNGENTESYPYYCPQDCA